MILQEVTLVQGACMRVRDFCWSEISTYTASEALLLVDKYNYTALEGFVLVGKYKFTANELHMQSFSCILITYRVHKDCLGDT